MDLALSPAPSLTPPSSSADMLETPLRPRDTRRSPPQLPPYSSPSLHTPVQPPPLRESSLPQLLLPDPRGRNKVAHSTVAPLRSRPARRSSVFLMTILLEPGAAVAFPYPGGKHAPRRAPSSRLSCPIPRVSAERPSVTPSPSQRVRRGVSPAATALP